MYKPASFNPVQATCVLDLTGSNEKTDLHQILAQTFDFPDYYGRNWAALWDCMTDLACSYKKLTIQVRGVIGMEKEWYESCADLFELLDDLSKEYPHVSIHYLP